MDQVYNCIACINSAVHWACAGKGQDRVGKGIAEGRHDYALPSPSPCLQSAAEFVTSPFSEYTARGIYKYRFTSPV